MPEGSIQQALRWATAALDEYSDSPKLDAEVLLAFCLGKPRSYLFSWPERALNDREREQFESLIKRRKAPTPVAYLIGVREFYSLSFQVNPAVLVPRPETELLVDEALSICHRDQPGRIIDLGTGSGIIAVSVKKHYPAAEMWATDLSPAALEVAANNARQHSIDIHFQQSGWYEQLPAELAFDLILSNPPYIAAAHPFLGRGDLPGEPDLALSPGSSGLESLEIIVGKAPGLLNRGGSLVVEHGYDQERAVHDLFEAAGFTGISCVDDFNGHPRVTLGKLR